MCVEDPFLQIQSHIGIVVHITCTTCTCALPEYMYTHTPSGLPQESLHDALCSAIFYYEHVHVRYTYIIG